MSEHLLVSLALIIFLGIGAQWAAWRIGVPSILLLLITGFVTGPVLGWIKPDQLLGSWVSPLVSVSVGLILFEGGLTLKFRELKAIGSVVRNLITIGALITCAISAAAAHWIFGWDWALATLMGAILTVTGPTVVMPLLRHIKPARQVGSVLKWEGILIDPVGAVLALLVFEAVLPGASESVLLHSLRGFGATVLVGSVLGITAGLALASSFKRFWVPDHLQNPMALMVVVAVFTISNELQHESGLLTVTVMGITLANQRSVYIRHIVEFKENLRVLLTGGLFIILASRVRMEDVERLSLTAGLAFLAVLVLIVRPLTVWISAAGSTLNWKECLFLSWMAPRGIVAASVASIFALRLQEAGNPRAVELVPVTFLVIVGTVTLYGLTAGPLAKWLSLSKPNPQGVLFVGANPLAQSLAKALKDEGFQVLLADTNWENLTEARLVGLPTYYGNVLSEHARDEVELSGIGRMLALTRNQEVNTLAAMHFVEFFGRSEVYQIQVAPDLVKKTELEPHGRLLFGKDVFLVNLGQQMARGLKIRKTRLTKEFTYEAWKRRYGGEAVPLILIEEGTTLKVFTAGDPPSPTDGRTLIALVPDDSEVEG